MIIFPQLPLYVIAIICGLLAFMVTHLSMPRIIKKLENADIVGKDLHKSWKPIVAEMGGFGILFGFIIGMFSGIYMHDILAFSLCIVLIVILLVGIIGIADDLLVLSSKEKLLLLFLAGLPLIWAAPSNVGILYLISIPIAISIGLNGIESGLGIISLASLTISCIILGKSDVTIISMSMLGALIAFLYYNKYPAKIFPGDTGTLIIGATIVSVAFIGRVKLIAFIVLMPNIIDAAMKFYSAGVMERQQFKPTQVDDEGNLIRPETGFKSLIRWVIRRPITEKQAVHIIWGIGLIFGILGIFVALTMPGVIGNQTLANFLQIKEMFYHIWGDLMKPYVILNAAMTLDGKIVTAKNSSNISGEEDLERVHKLRKNVDAIMVGIGTVLADDPRLTVHKVDANPADNPVRVVVDSKCRTPIAARITNKDAKTIIAGANEFKYDFLVSDRCNVFKQRCVDFFFSGDTQVDLTALMNHLASEGIETLMLEGGATLNFAMIKEGLIDELRICIAPKVVGGVNAKTLFDGEGFDTMDEGVNLELTDSFKLGKDLILIYKVLK